MNHFLLYIILQATGIKNAFLIIDMLLFVSWVIFSISYLNLDKKSKDEMKAEINPSKIMKMGWISFLLLLISYILIPSSKNLAAIYIIPKISNEIVSNEKIRSIPDDILNLLGEWIKELYPNKEE